MDIIQYKQKFHLGEYAKRVLIKFTRIEKNGLGGEDLWVNVIENSLKIFHFHLVCIL